MSDALHITHSLAGRRSVTTTNAEYRSIFVLNVDSGKRYDIEGYRRHRNGMGNPITTVIPHLNRDAFGECILEIESRRYYGQ